MSLTTLPGAMTGPVRRIHEPASVVRYVIQVRRLLAAGAEEITRSMGYADKPTAEHAFEQMLTLGCGAYSIGRYRLVLISADELPAMTGPAGPKRRPLVGARRLAALIGGQR